VKRIADNEKGASAVEFAIILPLLVIMVFGIIEFGLLFYDKAVVTNASREAARAGIVFQPDPRVSTNEIEYVGLNYCGSRLVTFGNGPGPIVTVPSGACEYSGDELAVTVTYQYEFLLLPDFLVNLFSGSMPGTIDVSAVTRMRCE
jgi:Flp pilus assembly protein TadG